MKKDRIYRIFKKIITIILWLGLATAAIFAIYKANLSLNNTEIGNIVITISPQENGFITKEEIKNLLKYNLNAERKNYGSIRLDEIEYLIKSNVYVKDVECYTDMSGSIYIDIIQRQPFIRVFRFDGESYFIDKTGIKIPLSTNQTSHCMVVNGNIFERYEEEKGLYSQALNKVYKIATYVDNDEFFKDQIDQIFVQANNEFVLVPKVTNHIVLLGSAESLEDKMNRLKFFYRNGLNKVGWNKYKQINLKYSNQIICTRQ